MVGEACWCLGRDRLIGGEDCEGAWPDLTRTRMTILVKWDWEANKQRSSVRSGRQVRTSAVQKQGRHDHVTMVALYVLDDDSLGNDGEWRRAHQSLPLVAAREGHTRGRDWREAVQFPQATGPGPCHWVRVVRVRGWLLRWAGRLGRAGLGWAGLGLGREAQVLTDVTYLELSHPLTRR